MNMRIDTILIFSIRTGFILLLLTPIIVTSSTLFPYVVGKAIYARIIIEVVFALWIVLAVRSPAHRLPHSWILWLFGVFTIASFISALVGVSFDRSFWGDYRRMGGVFDLMHWLAISTVLASVLIRDKDWRWLLNANIGVSLGIAILGLSEHYDIGILRDIFWYLEPIGRADMTFGNPAYAGSYMLVNFFIAVALMADSFEKPIASNHNLPRKRQTRSRRHESHEKSRLRAWRFFWCITGILNFWVFTLAGTRGAAVGLLAGLILAGAVYIAWGNRPRLRVWAGILTAILAILVLFSPLSQNLPVVKTIASSNVLAQRLSDAISTGLDTYAPRLTVIKTGLRAFGNYPLLGWGPENFSSAFDKYVDTIDSPTSSLLADQAHNKPIEELISVGSIGFILYIAMIGRIFWVILLSVRKKPTNQLFVIFLGAALIGYVVQNLFLFDTPGTFLLYILLFSWVIRKEVPNEASPASQTNKKEHHTLPILRVPNFPWMGRWGNTVQFIQANSIIWPALLAILTMTSLYLFNYKPFQAAQILPKDFSSLDRFLDDAQLSFETFPPMAGLGRQIVIDTFVGRWDIAQADSEQFLLAQAQKEGMAVIAAEPHNARIHIGLARLYQRAADPMFIPISEYHVESAKQLAPRLLETMEIAIAQKIYAKDYDEALSLVYQYINLNPETTSLLEDLESTSRRALTDEIGLKEYYCRHWYEKKVITLEDRAKITCPQGYYGAISRILGPSGTILPLIDETSGVHTSRFYAEGLIGFPADWSAPLQQFDYPSKLKDFIPLVRLNGKDEIAQLLNSDYWSNGNGVKDTSFSLGAWINLAKNAKNVIFTKQNLHSPGKEWAFLVDAEGSINLTLYDENSSTQISKSDGSFIRNESWAFVVATYNGDGTPDGITLYWDRDIHIDNTKISNVNHYKAMEHSIALPTLGGHGDTGGHFIGTMAGGPIGPFFTKKELTQSEVEELYTIGRSILGYS